MLNIFFLIKKTRWPGVDPEVLVYFIFLVFFLFFSFLLLFTSDWITTCFYAAVVLNACCL